MVTVLERARVRIYFVGLHKVPIDCQPPDESFRVDWIWPTLKLSCRMRDTTPIPALAPSVGIYGNHMI